MSSRHVRDYLTDKINSADAFAGICMSCAIVASFSIGLIYILTLTVCIQVGSLFTITALSSIVAHSVSNTNAAV